MVSLQDLRKSDIFNGLDDAELDDIARLCREHVCEPDSICFTEGSKAEDVHLLREGKVEIEE